MRAWLIDQLATTPADASIPAKCGGAALTFSGNASTAGAKGDFVLAGPQKRPCRMLGVWVYLPEQANADKVGLQMLDGEGEYLALHHKADWQGWKWLELDAKTTKFLQAYPQPGKNGQLDQPLKEISVVWYTNAAGPTSLAVDGLVAAVEPDPATGSGTRMSLLGTTALEPGGPLAAQLMVTNFSSRPVSANVEFSVQENPALVEVVAPDPEHGTDHALHAKSWTECEGKKIEEGSLTDGSDLTGAGTEMHPGRYSEAFQFIDLGSERRITHLRYTGGDANWYWKVDVAASADGDEYRPVGGLQGLDWHQKWGRNELPVSQPFAARHLRLRYHNDGKKSDVIRMPVALSVYDGLEDEKATVPVVGRVVGTGRQQVEIPANSFSVVPLSAGPALQPGSYFIAARLEGAGRAQAAFYQAFVMPPVLPRISPQSRFGMNTSDVTLAGMNRRLGVGWVRFENMKWPFVSPSAGVYAFDGSVGPWHVRVDEIITHYRAQGLSFLPTMFLTPTYLKSEKAPADSYGLEFPPRDLSKYGEFCFQTAARYAAVKHPAEALLTADKKSGLGQMRVYELWNEPDMNDPGWGSWRGGSIEQYYEMFRFGAEGVKRADPAALVCNGGFADFKVKFVDKLRTHRYSDGKSPLDFVDVLSVHHYTGTVAPEIATGDFNVERTLETKGKKTYEEELQQLAAWRKQHKPGMQIWLTETGYETGGPIAVSERQQAAYLVRNLMMAFAAGIDKVFVYREVGSGHSLFSASGMVRNDGSYKPSWFTLATLIRQMEGVSAGWRLLHPDQNVRLYRWRRGEQSFLSAWTIKGESAVEFDLGKCMVTDAFGHSRPEKLTGQVQLTMLPTYIAEISNSAGLDALENTSRAQEQARKDEVARLSRLRAYLFDFGSREHVGSIDVGNERLGTPVLATDLWDAAKGFGFEPKAAMNSEVFGGNLEQMGELECDAVRMGADTRFRLRAEPGRYRLRIKANPLQPDLQFTISGASGGEKMLPISDSRSAEIDVEISGESLVLQPNRYLLLQWISLVEQK